MNITRVLVAQAPRRAFSTAATATSTQPYRVLVLGGYGTFGGYVSQALSRDPHIALTVAGRDQSKAQAYAQKLSSTHKCDVASACVDVFNKAQLRDTLRTMRPELVIHTCGPFQGQGYEVAKQCIEEGVNYVDLADGREFVCEIDKLDDEAKQKNVVVISGASSVPGLSGAVVQKYKEHFESINSIEHYINPGNQTERGIATVQSVLAYCGQKVKISIDNSWKKVIGWQDTHAIALRGVGSRLVSTCDIPDLEIFPKWFKVPTVKFYAGLELRVLHLATVAMSHLVNRGLVPRIDQYAAPLRKLSLLFFNFGTKSGGMSVRLRGTPKGGQDKGKELSLEWQVGVHDGDGPQVPSICAIVIAKKLAAHATVGKAALYPPGARPCLGFFTQEELETEMQRLKAYFYVEKKLNGEDVRKENLYEKSIGDSYFEKLPPSLQTFHSAQNGGSAEGLCSVTRGNFFANMIASLLGLPQASSHSKPTVVKLNVETDRTQGNSPNSENWKREFDGKKFVSHQKWSEKEGLMIESYGLLQLGLRVRPIAGGFAHEHVFTKLFGIKLPLFIAPRAHATTIGTDKGWNFDVKVMAPLLGLLVRYQGEIAVLNKNHK